MKIVYYCYGSAHSSVTAANIHLGALPADRRPSLRDIRHQPLFDRAEDYQVGTPFPMGTDAWGNEVYVLGLAGGKRPMVEALHQFLELHGIDRSQICFEDVLQHAGVLLRIGGYSSRRLHWIGFGRPLCALGVWFKYERFAGHVRRLQARFAPPVP